MVAQESQLSDRCIPIARDSLVREPKGLKASSLGQSDDIVDIDKVLFSLHLYKGAQERGSGIGGCSGIAVNDCAMHLVQKGRILLRKTIEVHIVLADAFAYDQNIVLVRGANLANLPSGGALYSLA